MQILLLDLGKEMRGGQWQVYYLARALARAEGFSPIVAAPRKAPLYTHVQELEGVRAFPLSATREWDPRALFALRRLVHTEGVRIIHTHCAKSAALGAFAKKRWPDAVTLIHSRRVSYPLKNGWRGKKYLLADAIAAVSSEIAGALTGSGMPAEKVHVIHSGIDTARYTPKRDRGDGRFVIGMVGALSAQKGHEVLIRSLAELENHDDMPPWEVRMIGGGDLFPQLEALARELGVERRIAMLGWQDARQFLPDFDILTVPSVDGEGSSGAIKEGWATGLPVICSDLPSNTELVRNGENGLTFPNRNHSTLAAHIYTLAKDAQLRDKLIEGGTASAKTFTDMKMAQAYIDLYTSLS